MILKLDPDLRISTREELDSLSWSEMRRILFYIVFACCVALPATLVLWAILRSFQASEDEQCKVYLRHVYLALHDYIRGHRGFLPPPYIKDKEGTPTQSWRAVILPSIMPYEHIFGQYKISEPWNSPHNAWFANAITPYACPTHSQSPDVTNYLAVVGENTLWTPPMRDGPYEFPIIGERTPWPCIENRSQSSGSPDTIVLVELVQSDIPWAEPRDITLDDFLNTIRRNPKGSFYNTYINGIRAVDASGKIIVIDPNDAISRIREMFLVKHPRPVP
jgi:hypothetical protein